MCVRGKFSYRSRERKKRKEGRNVCTKKKYFGRRKVDFDDNKCCNVIIESVELIQFSILEFIFSHKNERNLRKLINLMFRS